MGRSFFNEDFNALICMLNSSTSKDMMSSLNPSVHFQTGDVNRLPVFEVEEADMIMQMVEMEFDVHEMSREASVEFREPGPSPWRSVQEWAQVAVDRPAGAPLPYYDAVLDEEPPTDHLSFALGVALGRFGKHGEGILDPRDPAQLVDATPDGIVFLDTTLDEHDLQDSLGHDACALLHAKWAQYGPAISSKRSLREWLAWDFFKDVHRGMYENRPIHWPLTSANKTFVAWVTIHRFDKDTLRVLMADHLLPAQARIEAALKDVEASMASEDKKTRRDAERRHERLSKALEELAQLVADITQCDSFGPPPTSSKCPKREQDARYAPDLDDGVMINSAALWPLLEPQWKDPKKWWEELCVASGRKDYDWSHLAMRYFPERVDAKCQQDPSLGVAHGCFWRYHPARAWAWELRLQHEIAPDFRIDEPDSDTARAAYLANHPLEAIATVEREAERRQGRGERAQPIDSLTLLESGLWSAHPDAMRQAQERLSQRQDAPFTLLAPDL